MDTDVLAWASAETLATLTGAHLTTALRWKRAKRIRRWLYVLVSVCVRGELESISKTWSGWSVRGPHLVSPEGWQFTPGEVRSIPFMKAQVRAYQDRQHFAQADWIAQRYVEGTCYEDDELSAAAG